MRDSFWESMTVELTHMPEVEALELLRTLDKKTVSCIRAYARSVDAVLPDEIRTGHGTALKA